MKSANRWQAIQFGFEIKTNKRSDYEKSECNN